MMMLNVIREWDYDWVIYCNRFYNSRQLRVDVVEGKLCGDSQKNGYSDLVNLNGNEGTSISRIFICKEK